MKFKNRCAGASFFVFNCRLLICNLNFFGKISRHLRWGLPNFNCQAEFLCMQYCPSDSYDGDFFLLGCKFGNGTVFSVSELIYPTSRRLVFLSRPFYGKSL